MTDMSISTDEMFVRYAATLTRWQRIKYRYLAPFGDIEFPLNAFEWWEKEGQYASETLEQEKN